MHTYFDVFAKSTSLARIPRLPSPVIPCHVVLVELPVGTRRLLVQLSALADRILFLPNRLQDRVHRCEDGELTNTYKSNLYLVKL